MWVLLIIFGAVALIMFLFGVSSTNNIRSSPTDISDKVFLWCEVYLYELNNTIAVILKQWTMVWLSTSIHWAPERVHQAVSWCCCSYTRWRKLISLLYTKSLTPTTWSNKTVTTCTQDVACTSHFTFLIVDLFITRQLTSALKSPSANDHNPAWSTSIQTQRNPPHLTTAY